jgi:acetyltransferase-like isoleucine patch superfamily enzyme
MAEFMIIQTRCGIPAIVAPSTKAVKNDEKLGIKRNFPTEAERMESKKRLITAINASHKNIETGTAPSAKKQVQQKKFRLVSDITATYYVDDDMRESGDGITVYRIQALRTFVCDNGKKVCEGDYGGFVEKEFNLSQRGNCWIYDDAVAVGEARVKDHAVVHGHAEISDYARVNDHAHVGGNAKIIGESIIGGHSVVGGNVVVISQKEY